MCAMVAKVQRIEQTAVHVVIIQLSQHAVNSKEKTKKNKVMPKPYKYFIRFDTFVFNLKYCFYYCCSFIREGIVFF